MADYGSRYADRRQKIIELRLRRTYAEAQKDLQTGFDAFCEKYRKQAKMKQLALAAGKITQSEYDSWLRGQIFQGKRWRDRLEDAAVRMEHANAEALAIIRKEQYNVFAENANFTAFHIENMDAAISFDTYDENTVRRLVEEKPELMPPRTLNGRKDRAWNQGIIANTLTQGIIQGESIPEIAERMARDTARMNDAAMVRYARSAMTSAQNAGRIETLNRALEMGLNVKKKWSATLDSRTRDSHRDLDGQIQDVNKPFQSPLGAIRYPGDIQAHPGDYWNCRCTLVYVNPDYPRADDGWEASETIDGVSYQDWKKGKNAPTAPASPSKLQQKVDKAAQPAKKKAPANMTEKGKAIVDALEASGVKKFDVAQQATKLTEKEIIDKIGGGDMTKGSCASLSLCYAGNKAGYDVRDFRGGESLSYFARRITGIQIGALDGVTSYVESDYNDFKAAQRLIEHVETGKEYRLGIGKHSAIIRKEKDQGLQYLELQSATDNGWHKLDNDALRHRFGCTRSHSLYGTKVEVNSYLTDIETLGKSKDFPDILGYINTEADKQKKGSLGFEK